MIKHISCNHRSYIKSENIINFIPLGYADNKIWSCDVIDDLYRGVWPKISHDKTKDIIIKKDGIHFEFRGYKYLALLCTEQNITSPDYSLLYNDFSYSRITNAIKMLDIDELFIYMGLLKKFVVLENFERALAEHNITISTYLTYERF